MKNPHSINSYWKTPYRQVYSEGLWDCVKSTLWCHIGIKVAIAFGYVKIPQLPKSVQAILIIAWASLGALALPGCASGITAGTVVSDLVQDVESGLVVAQDVYTAANAVNQNLDGHGLSIGNILSSAGAATTSANSTGLATAVNTLVLGVSSQIASLKASGATPAAIVTAVSQTTASAETAVAGVIPPSTPATTSSGIWTPTKQPEPKYVVTA